MQCGTDVTGVPAAKTQQMTTTPAPAPAKKGTDPLLDAVRHATLGEYEILGELGRGGMAAVYLAHDLSLNRKVALKVVLPMLLEMGSGIGERFKREAQTSAGLSHPHIIPVYAVKEHEHVVYFVMKYVKGRTLESVIHDFGAIPITVTQTILNQVASALGYAHRNGVIHRDIKPGNILLDREGWAVVTDFGIAKVTELQALTMTGATVGTPTYMSPEQCSGVDVTAAADQYSLGVVAYEMVTGQLPFASGSPMTVMYEHVHTPAPHLANVMPDCPEQLATAIMRMLEKKPEDRWPTIEDAVAAIGVVTDTDQQIARTSVGKLAQRGSASAILEKFKTPGSPIPMSRSAPSLRTSKEAPTSSVARRRAMWGVPVALIATAAAWLVFGRGNTEPTTPAESSVPTMTAAEPAAPAIARLEITGEPASLAIGETVQLSVRGYGADGNEVVADGITWESDALAVASVSASGFVEAVAQGVARLSARRNGQSATVSIRVSGRAAAPPTAATATRLAVSSVGLAPESASIAIGERTQLRAMPRASTGADLPDREVIWTSSNPGVATVSASGIVTALAEGAARVTASSERGSGQATITVTQVLVSSITVTPTQSTIEVGATIPLSAEPRTAGGSPLPDRLVTWRSSNPAVLRVSAGGVASGIAAGTAVVTAASGGVEATATLTVRATAPAPANPPEPPPAAVDARPAIESVLQRYGEAIEARDVARVRQVYPDMTAAQERAWRDFFAGVEDLEVTLTVLALTIDGDHANARVAAMYDYQAARKEHRAFEFRATFRRVASGWQILTIQ